MDRKEPATHDGQLANGFESWRKSRRYALVKKALGLRGPDPEMEFAAALITLEGPLADHQEHVQKATAGAKGDPLLAQNLKSHFLGEDGITVAELFSKGTKANQ